jgi:hypothetical protein
MRVLLGRSLEFILRNESWCLEEREGQVIPNLAIVAQNIQVVAGHTCHLPPGIDLSWKALILSE